jgi:class 3 adenylate cyclase
VCFVILTFVNLLLIEYQAFYIGPGDLHDSRYTNTRRIIPFLPLRNAATVDVPGHCLYSLHVYASQDFEDDYRSNTPMIISSVIAVTFAFMLGVFLVYDWFVHRRNDKFVGAAERSTAIVSAMFPSNFRNRLYQDSYHDESKQGSVFRNIDDNNKSRLKRFMADGTNTFDEDGEERMILLSKPIADLFTETTVSFADIAGFTAWSSMRQPADVFVLLETLYKSFDEVARIHGIYKVETIGDCYVAVAGLPEPRSDHAVIMCRFARECMRRMQNLVKQLEVRLGPDTGELSMRFGLHSGPVTAGVLRGERSRFQLFGDTMNVAARIESTGKRDHVHLSEATANEVIGAGKGKWLKRREDTIELKGIGEMTTYWLILGRSLEKRKNSSRHLSMKQITDSPQPDGELDEKAIRLVKWHVETLLHLLRLVEASRARLPNIDTSVHVDTSEDLFKEFDWPNDYHTVGTPLEEVQEIIHLPAFRGARDCEALSESIHFDFKIEQQLTEFVRTIAMLYRRNAFHNFEHASHVTMSVAKLMSRIVAPDLDDTWESDNNKCLLSQNRESTLHDFTYGITSDPLTQFACVFSALIHDIDHTGVPNTQLLKENPHLAEHYKGKSLAEQNSVDLAWDLLMQDNYVELRNIIASTSSEHRRFRHLVVNSVMATDIMDPDLKKLRNSRWNVAFAIDEVQKKIESTKDTTDRKATIVIEHLIQASDVAHTMQHWHVYRKWNERLFVEMYQAFAEGRSDQDPSNFWYRGEIGFFDFYVIPLAKKLKDCGVFGVSSSEYLDYALKNRREWEERGEELVCEMREKVLQS